MTREKQAQEAGKKVAPESTEKKSNVGVEIAKKPVKIAKAAVESKFMAEFREFINRGSIVDLAIGVAVGGAFTAIVNSLVNDIIMPVTSLLAGGLDFSTLSIDIPNLFGADMTAHIAYGNFLQNVINFLVIAVTVFLMVRFINRLNRKAIKSKEGK